MSNQDCESLTTYLQYRDVECPACAYNLRGLATDRCPECHQQLVISVSLAEPPVVQFVLATVGLAACGVGFGMLFLMTVAISLKEHDFPPGKIGMALIWSPLSIAVIDAFAVSKFLSGGGRRWFRTRARKDRSKIVAYCWGASLFVFAAWITVVLAKVA